MEQPRTTFYYRAHGLNIASELELPELGPGRNDQFEKIPDVDIRIGAVSEPVEEIVDRGPTFVTAPGVFFMEIENVGRFSVRGGTEILVEPQPTATQQILGTFVLGSAFGAMLHQRGFLAIHASGIRTENGAVLFAGRSGVGKSTVLNALVKRGYPALCDDVCAIRFDENGSARAEPAFPSTRLCEDAVVHLETESPNELSRMPLTPKYVVPLTHFWTSELPVSTIYLLELHNVPELAFEPLRGAEAVGSLIRNTYRRRYLFGLGLESQQFESASRLVDSTPVTRIRRPPNLSLLEELLDQVESNLATPTVS